MAPDAGPYDAGHDASDLDAGTGGAAGGSSDAGDAGDADGGTIIVADCTDGWCKIPAGTFTMGSPEDEWGRGLSSEDEVAVTLTRDFLIQQHELTQAEWTAFGLPNPSSLSNDQTGDCLDSDCPVGNVTWFETLAFANLMSQAQQPPLAECYTLTDCVGQLGEGLVCASVVLSAPTLYACEGFRLPTEAEWEYAARAGTTTAFYSGDITAYPQGGTCYPDENLEKIAWYCQNAGSTTHAVGGKEPNGWGLYDMSGNAYEWVNDEYTPSGYGEGPLVDPDGTMVPGEQRVKRGGRFSIWSTLCRSASRMYQTRTTSAPGVGFRLVRTLHDNQ